MTRAVFPGLKPPRFKLYKGPLGGLGRGVDDLFPSESNSTNETMVCPASHIYLPVELASFLKQKTRYNVCVTKIASYLVVMAEAKNHLKR